MKTETKITKTGGSLCVIIPRLYLNHINCDEGDEIVLQDDEGKHGAFISFWKKEKK